MSRANADVLTESKFIEIGVKDLRSVVAESDVCGIIVLACSISKVNSEIRSRLQKHSFIGRTGGLSGSVVNCDGTISLRTCRNHELTGDVLYCIAEHLSLGDLVCLSEAFDSKANAVFPVTKRQAIKTISALLRTGQVRNQVVIADNGACYKFQLKNPRAGPYRHQKDHAKDRPCGRVYNPSFPHTMQYECRKLSELLYDYLPI